jgi:hypothetical protein
LVADGARALDDEGGRSMSFLVPQALLLLIPGGLLLWRTGRLVGPPMWLRVAMLGLLVLALARPELQLREAGSDVVVIVDRSRSMPPGAESNAEEFIRLLLPQRRAGDRLGVISFGREARIEMPLSHDGIFGGFGSAIDGEASNLGAALDAAGDLIPPERTGRVLVVSDGRATGLDARAAARRLAARGISVDVRWLGREDSAVDVAVSGLEVPASVSVKEPFQLTATLKATQAVEAQVTLTRAGRPLVKLTRKLDAGNNLLTFRDLISEPGLAGYELRVEAPGDGVPENDVGRAVVRVEGPPRVLLLTDNPNGTLAKTLRDANLELVVKAPFAVDLSALENVGAVVLENVEAGRLSENGLHVLAQYVKEAGGGLVMTGGQHSFGEGGYRKSPVEELLPVSLEVREEQRKAAVAISIIMDCSCSMGATVPDGRTKMELAAEGVVGALQLLNPRDEASVAMVDTDPHVLFDMTPVVDGLPLNKVARGFSGGGGIYIDVGMHTARKEILSSEKPTRHVLLFSDAADSEQGGDYSRTVDELVAKNVSVSVIGMGKPTDSDAELLRDIARRGKGRIYFAEDATSLPRIFSQETIAVARASFVDTPVGTRLGPDLAQLGRIPAATQPRLGGYNLTYVKHDSSVGLKTDDESGAPIVAMWPHGAGRVVALTAEVDGKYTGGLHGWEGERSLLEQVVRWVMPPQLNAMEGVARARLEGDDLHVTLDFDPSAPPPAGVPTLVLLSGDARGRRVELPMRWEDVDRVGAHFVLPGSGTWHPVVKLGDRVFRAPPVTLPWAPEFEPSTAKVGHDTLSGVAKAGGGVERLSMTGLFAEAMESEAGVPLAPFSVLASLLVLVSEVFVRRFVSGPRVKRPVVKQVPVQPTKTPIAQTPATRAPVVEAPAPSEEPVKKAPGVNDALAQARDRARRRTDR